MKKIILYLTVFMMFILLISIITVNLIDDEEKEDGPDSRPNEWAWNQRVFPHYDADPLANYEAAKEAIKMREDKKLRLAKSNDTPPEWEFAGPLNIGGRIVDIEYNPLNPDIVYASAATGGVLKSYDGGQNWIVLFENQPVLPMGDLAVDPVDTNIVYAGSGEPNGSHNNFPGAGVFKTYNGGLTWENIGLELTAHIGRIIIDPNNTQRVFVAAVGSNFGTGSDRGLYRSLNGGTDWEQVLFVSDSTGAIDVILNPDEPEIVLAAMWERVRRPGYGQTEASRGRTSGIYKSTDGGDTWNKLGDANGLPAESDLIGRIGLDYDAQNPSTVVAVYTDGGTYTGLYKSTDNGENWTDIDPSKQITQGVATFSWYFGQVRINPHNPDYIYVLDYVFNYTSNGGNSWDYSYWENLHVDHHALAFHPTDPNIVLVGNDGGINKSTNKGQTWQNHVKLPVTQFYEINIDYSNPNALYGGTQDNNTIRTLSGNLDDWQPILGGDGFYVNIDYNDNNYVYAEYQNGELYRSTTGGSDMMWAQEGISTTEPRNWSTPVVMDPLESNILYFGTNRLYKTTNRAVSWTAISPNLTLSSPQFPRFGTLTTISVSPIDNNIIFTGSDDGKVFVTTDGGDNWQDITEGLPLRWVTRVAADNYDENTVYVTFSGLKWDDPEPRVFRSTDLGQNWINISSNLPQAPVNAIALDYTNENTIYLGTDVGAFVSFNKGESWEVLGEGLPVVSVYDLKIHPVTNYLIAGTHGRSMYKLDLDKITGVSEPQSTIVDGYELAQNYPNPFNPSTTISFTIPKEEFVNISIYNTNGELVKTLADGVYNAGTHKTIWYSENNHGRKAASGVYLYKLTAGNSVISKKMIMLK